MSKIFPFLQIYQAKTSVSIGTQKQWLKILKRKIAIVCTSEMMILAIKMLKSQKSH
jgi:hypothetical protein